MTLYVTASIVIPDEELQESFVRAAGPGGQNVNKVETAVELRFDALNSPSLPEGVRIRLLRMAGRRATENGVIVVKAQEHRFQARNREAARQRLAEMIRAAAAPPPPPRKATKPTLGSQKRRLAGKTIRGNVKKMRGSPGGGDDD